MRDPRAPPCRVLEILASYLEVPVFFHAFKAYNIIGVGRNLVWLGMSGLRTKRSPHLADPRIQNEASHCRVSGPESGNLC